MLSILETIVYRLEPSPRGAIKLVRDACSLTDADKLRAAGSEAGGVKFDWEREERENSPPGKTQDFPLCSGNLEEKTNKCIWSFA